MESTKDIPIEELEAVKEAPIVTFEKSENDAEELRSDAHLQKASSSQHSTVTNKVRQNEGMLGYGRQIGRTEGFLRDRAQQRLPRSMSDRIMMLRNNYSSNGAFRKPTWGETVQHNRLDATTPHRHVVNKFGQPTPRPYCRIGFSQLEEWSNLAPSTVIVKIIKNKPHFALILRRELTGDTIVMVVKVLAKLCLSPFNVNKTDIMRVVCEKFIYSLQNFILQLQEADAIDPNTHSYFWKDINDFFSNILIICETLIATVPTIAHEILPKILMTIFLILPTLTYKHDKSVSAEIKEKFLKLDQRVVLFKSEVTRTRGTLNFRYLSVYPKSEEILSESRVFLRKNIIDGKYKNVDDYLDVQFRLLKEDFVAPLREAICSYIQSGSTTTTKQKIKISNVRIHPHVEFLSPILCNNELGVILQFDDFKHSQKTPYNNYSRRFMYGSLVCFTNDHFATILFGRIVNRDLPYLEKKQIVIAFEGNSNNYRINTPYIMVECSIYFEPYYHVLTALQNIQESRFPMKDYIIDVNPDIKPPSYLLDSALDINDKRVSLFKSEWPSASELHLDNSQYNAFKAALTQEFVVIQGPPGTGKTFLGLKIAKTLIQNGKGPILVVCYTNHALDQFLEGLMQTTYSIVRVGGQSKNPKLEPVQLQAVRRRTDQSTFLFKLQGSVREILVDIATVKDHLDDIDKYNLVVHFQYFLQIDAAYEYSWFASASKKDMIEWLFGGRTTSKPLQREHFEIIEVKENEDQKIDRELDQVLAAQHRAMFDFVEEQEKIRVREHLLSLIGLRQLSNDKKDICYQIDYMEDDPLSWINKMELEQELYEIESRHAYLKMRLDEGKRGKVNRKPNLNLSQPHKMQASDRWKLYFYWLGLYRKFLMDELLTLQQRYHKINAQYMEAREIADTEIMRAKTVVGMTTTCAARLQNSLQDLKSPIVIVEEAAEVLESHIVVSLTNHCKHLILIGDHRQLRPTTANYRMQKIFNLGISLFERMVKNNLQCNLLNVQHRMRPDFAKLIVPAIYPELTNHSSVYSYPPIVGVNTSLYFIDHNHPEEERQDNGKQNMHEVYFLTALCKYFIQNGYRPEDITILAAYSAQMFAFWRERKKHSDLLDDVRMTVLDNYQGEESKIILLSLVRNNVDGNIGFLKIENRVCVALSRAREGFYIMGNMSLLCDNSEIWPKIRLVLESQNAIGSELALHCQIHREEVTHVKCAEDFHNVPEGGCSKMCDMKLTCGHICNKICHILDREHVNFKCNFDCEIILCENQHKCPKRCSEECGPCLVPMKRLLKCLHEHDIECSTDLNTYKCGTLVEADLPCGHKVLNKPCHLDVKYFTCPFPCENRVEPCGHSCVNFCHVNQDPDHLDYFCVKHCTKPLNKCSTGQHMCKKKCFQSCDDCPQLVTKVHPVCGHKIRTKCSDEPNQKMCNERCRLLLSCGHSCTTKCKESCTTTCLNLVDHSKEVSCGHKFKIPCYLQKKDIPSHSNKILKYCTEPCKTILNCNHPCSGTYGKCTQGRIHATCTAKCGVPLICGHECTIPCRETCRPCTRNCSFRCAHSKCNKKCGVPCTKCKESCLRRCAHIRCKAKCGDICTVKPCTEPCPLKLQCGHPCVGFCGDPCPTLCRTCNHDELTDIFFGSEDNPNARFVVLEECNHTVESVGMERWLHEIHGNEIHYKCCPKCKTPLTLTQRYSDVVKKALADIAGVKKRYFGKNVETKRKQLWTSCEKLRSKCTGLPTDLLLGNFVLELNQMLRTTYKNRRQHFDIILGQTIEAKIDIIDNIVTIYTSAQFKNTRANEKALHHMRFLLNILRRDKERITKQEITDLEAELKRFSRIIQLCQVIDSDKFLPVISLNANVKGLYTEVENLAFSINIYTDEIDTDLKNGLVKLSKIIDSSVAITDTERREVAKAMGMRPGHWFKCPNGHIYAIGDCGGANQVSKCIDCGASVGGTNHALLPSNTHAGEMDGSRHAAFSETANNLLNFRILH